MGNAKGKAWSYRTGEKGVNRVRAFEKRNSFFLEFRERNTGSGGSVKKRVALRVPDRAAAKLKAEELAAALRRMEAPQASSLTLRTLFYNWYLKEETPRKSPGKQRHDATCAEMFCRCFGAERRPETLNVRDWQKFIADRKGGTLAPLSVTADRADKGKNPRPVSDRQVAYDLKFLMAVLNFATKARDDRDVALLTHNPLKGLPYPKGGEPNRPMLTADRYQKMREVAPRIHPLCDTLFVLVHETGHRAASVRHLRWSDIDLETGLVRWCADYDKIGYEHVTPLSPDALAALSTLQKREGVIGDCWIFPSLADKEKPLGRETATQWWLEAERLAGLEHLLGMGFHSARRKFATELKGIALRELCELGGWKNWQTVVTVYQKGEIEAQRDALASRKALRAG